MVVVLLQQIKSQCWANLVHWDQMSHWKAQETQHNLWSTCRSCVCWNKINFIFLKSRRKQHKTIPAGTWLPGNLPYFQYPQGQIQVIWFPVPWELYLRVGDLSQEPETRTRKCLAQILHFLFPRLLEYQGFWGCSKSSLSQTETFLASFIYVGKPRKKSDQLHYV